ncbi:MAG: hypothetical protein A2992_06385 [Elusimicrobia bacterium RIFCSPLOWO2_01_FULL_59_12]|nr:MAG: hypothetical protein A2992_06385 [Elusimicrobia bacterium RIFCSPLOWO2_01_FULL_59_12]
MFRLRKIYPPFGTDTTPLWEYAYSEQVKVINGLCEVQSPITRDYLLNMGYQMVDEVVPLAEQPIPPMEPERILRPPKKRAKPRRGGS